MGTAETDWAALAATAFERAVRRAATARRSGAHVACGFTANVDRVVRLSEEGLAALLVGREIALDGRRVTQADTVDDLLTAVVQAIAAGRGIDLPVRDPGVQAWLLERVGGRDQVGGTGAQAAVTLAHLGFPVLLHLTGRSLAQIGALRSPGRIAVATTHGIVPAEEAVEVADPTMWHVALEYGAGLTARVGQRSIVAPRADRIIVSHDPVNADFRIDPRFAAALANPAFPVRGLLLSGFSQVTETASLERVLAEAVAALGCWRAMRPDLFVHLELGAMPRPALLRRVVDVFSPLVDSVGLNGDELRDLLGASAKPSNESNEEEAALASRLASFARQIPTPRVSLHSGSCCLTVTAGAPERERDALLVGSLVASTRARTGAFPTVAALSESLADCRPHPTGQTTIRALGLCDGIGAVETGSLVGVPTPLVETPRATVGLGDSFTAGVLAMLAVPASG